MGSDNWIAVRLKEEIEIKHGYAFKGEYFCDKETDAILLTPGNFKIGGGIKLDKLKYYEGPIPDEYILQEGDLLISMTDLSKNGDTLGYPAIIPYSSPKKYLHNQRLGKVVMKEGSNLDKGFLYWILRSRTYRDEVLASATGTTVRHTAPKRILAYSVSVPHLPEQQKIASILSALDDKIELNHQMNKTLEEMAQAIFKSWFVDFEFPNDEEGLPYRSSGGELVYSEELQREIPKGWEVKPIDEMAHFLNGLALQKYPPKDENYLPVIKIRELRQGITESSDKASPDIDKRYIVDDGDILFSWSGSLEVCIWCGGKGALNQQLFKVTSQTYPKWFCYQWIKFYLPRFQHIAKGKATTMGHIQRHHLSETYVLIPPKEIIEKMNEIMNSLIEKFINNNLESRQLVNLRDALLPKLLSGEIWVFENQKINK